MSRSRIEWLARPGTLPESWNPVTGCTPISEGCANCYARRMAKRLAGRFGYPEAPHEFDVTLHPDRLKQPLRWFKPRTVFMVSMGDLFHDDVPDEWIGRILGTISHALLRHTYIILTKRAERMSQFFSKARSGPNTSVLVFGDWYVPWPLPNVWLGVTAENQRTADERISILLQTPAAVRFVSVEPMLGPVDLTNIPGIASDGDLFDALNWRYGSRNGPKVHAAFGCCSVGRLGWVICGAETGSGARPMDLAWALDLRDQCHEAGVPYFFKRAGPGQDTPPDLAVREWPEA